MDRREALKITAAFLGTSIVGAQAFLSGCSTPQSVGGVLTEADLPLLNALSDVILPKTTQSPGASEAQVGKFILPIVRDCYDSEEALIFESGLRTIDQKANESYGKNFLQLETDQRTSLLIALDEEAMESEEQEEPHFYSMLLQLTLWGYFISEPGATQALRYNPIPGRYEGCIPYEKGQAAWA